jgi:hypothetical protein
MTGLEHRLLMCVDHELLAADLGSFPTVTAADVPVVGGSADVVAASVPLTDIPALHSRASATAKLYLDFDGDTTGTWGRYTPGTTPLMTPTATRPRSPTPRSRPSARSGPASPRSSRRSTSM